MSWQTHTVFNQPGPLNNSNLFLSDGALCEALAREGAGWDSDLLASIGQQLGTAESLELGRLANTNPPELLRYDATGTRLDDVRFHPAWHLLMQGLCANRVHNLPWEETARNGAFVARAARFMLQDLLGVINPNLKRTDSLPANLLATALCVLAWGYFLHQGVVDPLGGINTLWPLFGIANQMLAGMALMLCAVVLFKMKRQRYAWVALVPTAWLLVCTLTAGWQKAFSPDVRVGFLAIANKFQAMIDSGAIPPQYTESQLAQLVFNNRLDAGLTIFFMVVVVVLALFSIKTALAALEEQASRLTQAVAVFHIQQEKALQEKAEERVVAVKPVQRKAAATDAGENWETF